MKHKISKAEIILAEYLIMSQIKAGRSLNMAAPAGETKLHELMKHILELPVKSRLVLPAGSHQLITEFRFVHRAAMKTGSSISSVVESMIRLEGPRSYTKKSKSKSALRLIAFGLRAGLSLPQSIRGAKEMMGKQEEDFIPEISFIVLKEFLQDKALDDAFEVMAQLRVVGVDLSSLFLFLSGHQE